jgi:hypothetical protein
LRSFSVEMGDEQPSESATSPASGSTSANPPTLGGASEVINSSVDRRDGSSNKEKIECSWGGGDWTWGKPLSSEEPWEQVLCRAQVRSQPPSRGVGRGKSVREKERGSGASNEKEKRKKRRRRRRREKWFRCPVAFRTVLACGHSFSPGRACQQPAC